MPIKTQFIKREDTQNKSTRFFELREEGIQYVQELSGHSWTNFNAHDPGLILLETLCYAMTELGYKSNFSITDILQSVPNEIFHLQNNAFYEKQEIFSTHPVTLTDYRVLLIDRLAPEINNVWVETVQNEEDEFTGKYSVWLLADNEIEIDETSFVQKARDCMSAHRNLCEQVDEILFLQRKQATIHADIQLNDDSSPERVLAAFFYRLEEVYLNPTLKRFTEEELIEKGLSLDEIYNGPKTLHGHFDSKQFKEFPKNIEVEELTQMLFQIDEGVLKVNNFKVILDGKEYTDKIPLAHFLPQFLATNPEHQIHCFQKGIKLPIDFTKIELITNELKQGQHRNYAISLQKQQRTIPEGRRRNIASMLPIEHDLPTVFGLGNQTLPKNASIQEQQQKQQLRSYLQIMNVFLENASQTLSHTASFFSIYENMFTKLYQQPYTELSKETLQQRSLILDHLLARFAVKFPRYKEAQHTHEQLHTEIVVKEKCLQNIPELTANRGVAGNLSQPQWGTSNMPTVCKWLHLFLGNPDFTIRSVTQPMEQLKSCIRKKNRYLKDIPITEVLQKGMEQDNYQTVKNRKYFVVWLPLNNVKLYLGKRKTKAKAEQVIKTYCKTVKKMNTRSKRVFLVEGFLVDQNAQFSVSLFFPNWTAEIQNNRFMEFIKTQTVELLPAHIHASFYALPYDEMKEFETIYQELEHSSEQFNLELLSEYKEYQF